ncbi:MAG: hypothetical protein RIF32_01875 [Leptospirales bacterium]|jgi:hypothetical protein
MNQTMWRSMFRGAALGGGLAGFVFGFWFWGAVALNAPTAKLDAEVTKPFSYLFIAVPALIGALGGGALGFGAHRFQKRRYFKLLGVSGVLYLFAAWAVAGAIIVATMIEEGSLDPSGEGAFVDSLKLGFVGAIFMSPLCIPLILLLVFILERWTRRPRPQSLDS